MRKKDKLQSYWPLLLHQEKYYCQSTKMKIIRIAYRKKYQLITFFILSMCSYIYTTLLTPNVGVHEGISLEQNGACSVSHWKSQIQHNEILDDSEEMMLDLNDDDAGFLYFSFSQDGNLKANKKKSKREVDRKKEMMHSSICLNKTLPGIRYKDIFLGDFPSFKDGTAEISEWAAEHSPFEANFIMDYDIFANPDSELTRKHLIMALKHVDIAISRNPNRRSPSNGVQSGIIAYRNNMHSKLFHKCLAHVLRKGTFGNQKKITMQQPAIDAILQSPLGQFLRVNYLEPEFHCWVNTPSLKNQDSSSQFFTIGRPILSKDTLCYFRHSHALIPFLTDDCEEKSKYIATLVDSIDTHEHISFSTKAKFAIKLQS